EVRRAGGWTAVSGLRSTPPYAGNNAGSYETFTLDFEPLGGDGIRLHGRPGGTASFMSVAELDVWAAPPLDGPNQAPLAQAGPDLDGDAGTTIALDGSASFDANGDLLGYLWTQPPGPPA